MMRTTKRQGGSPSSSPAMVSSPSSSSPGALQQPSSSSSSSPFHGRHQIRFPKQKSARPSGRLSGSVGGGGTDTHGGPATAGAPSGGDASGQRPGRRNARRGQRGAAPSAQEDGRDATTSPTEGRRPALAVETRVSPNEGTVVGSSSTQTANRSERFKGNKNSSSGSKASTNNKRGRAARNAPAPRSSSSNTDINNNKYNGATDEAPAPESAEGNGAVQPSQVSEEKGDAALDVGTSLTKSEETPKAAACAVEAAVQTQNTVSRSASNTNAPSASPAGKMPLEETERKDVSQVADTKKKLESATSSSKQRKTREGDKPRSRNPPKSKNKNMKGVTASIPARRLRDGSGAAKATASPNPSTDTANVISFTTDKIEAPHLPLGTTDAPAQMALQEAAAAVGMVLPPAPDSSLASGAPIAVMEAVAALPAALHDPAIVEHQVWRASLRSSPAPGPDPAVLAKLPPDPCVVKVVGVAVPASAGAPSAGGGAVGGKTNGATLSGRGGGGVAAPSSSSLADQLRATSPASGAVAAAPSISDEDVQLSRRGLRFEAAPWRPSATFAFDVDEAMLLAQTAAVLAPAFPLPSTAPAAAGNGDALPLFAAPAPAKDFVAAVTMTPAGCAAPGVEAAVTTTTTTTVAAADEVPGAPAASGPVPIITSTLTKNEQVPVAGASSEVDTRDEVQEQHHQQQPQKGQYPEQMDDHPLSPSPTPPSLQTRPVPCPPAAPMTAKEAGENMNHHWTDKSATSSHNSSNMTSPDSIANAAGMRSHSGSGVSTRRAGFVSAFSPNPPRPAATITVTPADKPAEGEAAPVASAPVIAKTGATTTTTPHSLLASPGSSLARSDASPLRDGLDAARSATPGTQPSPTTILATVAATTTSGAESGNVVERPGSTDLRAATPCHDEHHPGLLTASTPNSLIAPAVTTHNGLWGSGSVQGHALSPPSSVMREDDGESSRGTPPLLMSPALDPTASDSTNTNTNTTTTTATTTTSVAAATTAAGSDRPATAPAIRRSAMTVTNTATGARMSSSTLTTPSGSPIGLWAVAENVNARVNFANNTTTTNSSGSPLPASPGTAATHGNSNSNTNHNANYNAAYANSGPAGALTPSWPSSSSANNAGVHLHPAAVRSAGSADYGMREFPAMPFPSSFGNPASLGTPAHPHQQQQQQQAYPSLSSFGGQSGGGGGGNSNNNTNNNSGGSCHTLTELSSGAVGLNAGAAMSSPIGPAASRSGGSSYLGSPQLSLQASSSLLLSNLQFPRHASSTSPGSGAGGAPTIAGAPAPTTGQGTNSSSFSLLQQPLQQPHFGFSPPVQGESDLDRVRHNRVAVSDMAAKNETTLLDTLFADAEADVIEDDESEMEMEEGMGGGDWWPAYPMATSLSPHTGVDSPDAYTNATNVTGGGHAFRMQQSQHAGFNSSPTVAGRGVTFGGGYWYQPGSAGGGTSRQQKQQQQRHSGGSAARPHYSPENHVHRAISASCASVASSTMSLLDPRQPPTDFSAAAVYDLGEDEEEWEMNSSAYADSLDEAQIQWIEEQLKATENPVGFF